MKTGMVWDRGWKDCLMSYEGKAIKGNAGEFAVDEHKSQGGCGEITAFLQ